MGVDNEIQLTDAIKLLLETTPIYSYEFDGTRYDCGTKLGFTKAIIPKANQAKQKINGIEISPVDNLSQAIKLLKNI